ncbi:MAG: hypothetical protein ACE5IO_00670 [Thermoplasmata archaeon]
MRLEFGGVNMKRDHFKATVEILAGGHGLTILRLLHSKGWSIASDVAYELDIHTTTASKYLAKLHEVGILNRRTRNCRTRKAYEYKLKSPRISLDFDISDGRDDNLVTVCEFYSSLLFAMLEKTEKIGWAMINPAVEEALSDLLDSSRREILDVIVYVDLKGGHASTFRNLKRAIESGELRCTLVDIKKAFRLLFERVLGLCREGVGSTTTGRIFRLALDMMPKRISNLGSEYQLLDAFPGEVGYDGK